jgi:DNA-directed RNA polymerase subunit RPC12/RpoP
LSEEREGSKAAYIRAKNVPDSCPHCGQELSPWQQVLLTVDRALVCRKCWYRIILDPLEEPKSDEKPRSGHTG